MRGIEVESPVMQKHDNPERDSYGRDPEIRRKLKRKERTITETRKKTETKKR